MPRKTVNNGSVVTIDEVFEMYELGKLALAWVYNPALFEATQFERYKDLCDKYSVDAARLFYVAQNRNQQECDP